MKTKWKRLLSSLLTLAMLLSLAPAAFAAEDDESETSAIGVAYNMSSTNTKAAQGGKSPTAALREQCTVTINDTTYPMSNDVREYLEEDASLTIPAPNNMTLYEEENGVVTWTWTLTSVRYKFQNSEGDIGDPVTTELTSNGTFPSVTVSYPEDSTVTKLVVQYLYTPTKSPTSNVTYNFNLPEGATLMKVSSGPYMTQTNKTTCTVEAVVGSTIGRVPADNEFSGFDDFIAYTTETDENGAATRTWYEFLGWQLAESDSDEDGETAAAVNEEETAEDANKPLTVTKEDMSVIGQWREIEASVFTNAAADPDAPTLRLTEKYKIDGEEYDSQISQHNTSVTAWSQDGKDDPLALGSDRQVYYQATMKMKTLIAGLLQGQKIEDETFAGFTINVDLDDRLELVTDTNRAVTFKFTCTFLEPTGEILDPNGNKIDCSTITKGSTTVFTVLADDLPNEFSIPVQWKPVGTGGYSQSTLQEEIALEVAVAEIPGEDEQIVKATGVIEGYIDLSKAGVSENTIISAILSDTAWKTYYDLDENGTIDIIEALQAEEHLKYELQNLKLVANTVYAHVNGPEPEPIVPKWETSKSKTATNLVKQNDGTYTSEVTLSLPAADYKPEIDVVFVIDDTHAGSGIFAPAAEKLLNELKDKENLSVNIGIVTFDAAARDWLSATTENELSGLVSLESNYDAIVTAIKTELSYSSAGQQQKIGGTDLEWPLAMAQEMLKTGTGTEQHVILFSDMYGYVYRGNLTVDGTEYDNVPVSKLFGNNSLAYLALYKTRYGSWSGLYQNYNTAESDSGVSNTDDFFRYSSWSAYWTIYQNLASAPSYTAPSNNGTPTDYPQNTSYRLTGFEKSSVLTYDRILSLLADGVQMTIVNNDFNPGGEGNSVGAGIQTIKNEMLTALENDGVTMIRQGKTINADEMEDVFEKLENKLLYVVDAGSTVVDYMGYAVDDYNFDFADDAESLTLTVGGEKYDVTALGDSKYGFGDANGSKDGKDYPFVLEYVKGNGKAGEHFTWYINVPVTKDKTVQLTYTIKLTNPQTADGTYGKYDEDGSKGYTGLYTNNSATLHPVDSNGNGNYVPEDFPKPTVSYTVSSEPVNTNGALSISKTVNNGDLNREFTFTVDLTDADGNALTGSYEYTGSKTGSITSGGTVTLTNGQSIGIHQLPDGTTYTVTETAVDGYTTTISGHDAASPYEGTTNTGTIKAGTAAVVHFTNTGTGENPDAPSLSVCKDLDKVNGKTDKSRVESGDRLTYTITVVNTGTVDMTGVTVTDKLPKYATFVSAAEGYTHDTQNSELTWVIDLNAGEEETFSVTVKVQNVAEGTRLINTAVAEWENLHSEYSVLVSVDEDEPYIPPYIPPTKPDPEPDPEPEPSKPTLNLEEHVAYIIGTDKGLIRPTANLTRAEAATIFFRLLTDESRAYYWSKTNSYTDVTPDAWYNNAVSTMTNAGILTGNPDGTFQPNRAITRAEFAAMAARFSDVVYDGEASFSDVPASHWAARYIALAEHLGWINGDPDGSFRPNSPINRAEAVTLINHVLERAVEEDHMLPYMVTWPDNLPGKWYYTAMQEASNSHEYYRTDKPVPGLDFNYEDWQKLLKAPDWAALERIWSTANSK